MTHSKTPLCWSLELAKNMCAIPDLSPPPGQAAGAEVYRELYQVGHGGRREYHLQPQPSVQGLGRSFGVSIGVHYTSDCSMGQFLVLKP